MKKKGFYNNENKEWSEKVKSFFKESGFYVMVVVGLCILAVGAVYFTTNHLISSPDDELEDGLIPDDALATDDDREEIIILDGDTEHSGEFALEDPEIHDEPFDYVVEDDPITDPNNNLIAGGAEVGDLDEPDVGVVVKPAAKPTQAPKPTKAPVEKDDKDEVEDKENDNSQEVIKLFGKTPEFVMPVEGKIILDYAMDRLLYSKTLDEWRTHTGIDIVAPRGDVVKSAGHGYIKEIKKDPCYGITITIDHENGYKTIYSNLASDSMVSVNQKVKANDAISSIGNTAIFECMDPPHLHFEVYKNDKLIDPKTILPKEKE